MYISVFVVFVRFVFEFCLEFAALAGAQDAAGNAADATEPNFVADVCTCDGTGD